MTRRYTRRRSEPQRASARRAHADEGGDRPQCTTNPFFAAARAQEGENRVFVKVESLRSLTDKPPPSASGDAKRMNADAPSGGGPVASVRPPGGDADAVGPRSDAPSGASPSSASIDASGRADSLKEEGNRLFAGACAAWLDPAFPGRRALSMRCRRAPAARASTQRPRSRPVRRPQTAAGRYAPAVEAYTRAIDACPSAVLYCEWRARSRRQCARRHVEGRPSSHEDCDGARDSRPATCPAGGTSVVQRATDFPSLDPLLSRPQRTAPLRSCAARTMAPRSRTQTPRSRWTAATSRPTTAAALRTSR